MKNHKTFQTLPFFKARYKIQINYLHISKFLMQIYLNKKRIDIFVHISMFETPKFNRVVDILNANFNKAFSFYIKPKFS